MTQGTYNTIVNIKNLVIYYIFVLCLFCILFHFIILFVFINYLSIYISCKSTVTIDSYTTMPTPTARRLGELPTQSTGV